MPSARPGMAVVAVKGEVRAGVPLCSLKKSHCCCCCPSAVLFYVSLCVVVDFKMHWPICSYSPHKEFLVILSPKLTAGEIQLIENQNQFLFWILV